MNRQRQHRIRYWIGLAFVAFGSAHSFYYIIGFLSGWEVDLWNLGQTAAGFTMAGIGRWIIAWREKTFRGGAKWLLRFVQACFCLGLVVMLTLYGLIWNGGQGSKEQQADYLVILGARVKGEALSLSLQRRLDRGMDYLVRYPNTKVIVSGGRGPGESVSEAEAMQRYLMAQGLNDERILLEAHSTSTHENLAFSKQLLLDLGERPEELQLALVTNDFHMYRSLWLADKEGLRAFGLPASTPPFTLPRSYLRECAALVKTFLFG